MVPKDGAKCREAVEAKRESECNMTCSDVKMEIQEDEQGLCTDDDKLPRLVRYQATKVGEDETEVLHDLLQMKTAVFGSLQVVSGLPSVGIGLTMAVSLRINESLVTLFRVAHVTGMLFILAGVVSSVLIRYPVLITVSLAINKACIVFAIVAVGLITTDLTEWTHKGNYLMMVLMELCILGFQLLLSVILCVWISKVKCGTLNN
ncbi:uncharacterized protein LOC109518028 isoform X1 [Hippocampus comes]|uniref:uncharacterized protein LOC109518028 isoform X1 n=1 Tax=Hippocampus comes TaxID=109280 RepID=UPI00094EAB30|nr:PREDICTED: uncharacterized protein LOC109518028 isoform X1 [Hippocampus comes]